MAGVKGRKFSQKTRQILREQKLGEKNPFYGKTHTPEVREKIRQAHLGRVQGIEWTKKRAMKERRIQLGKGEYQNPHIAQSLMKNLKGGLEIFGRISVLFVEKRKENTDKTESYPYTTYTEINMYVVMIRNQYLSLCVQNVIQNCI